MFDVIVVGLGSAGCMAGAIVHHFDKKVLGLEAMDRIGGRVYTLPLGDSVIELGAEWIHGTKDNSVHNMAVVEHIEVKKQGLVHKMFMSDGREGNETLLMELLTYAFDVLEHPPEVAEPLGQYITKKVTSHALSLHPEWENDRSFLENFLRWMNLMIGNHESCDNWNDVSTQTQYRELEGPLQVSWHKHGYKTMFDLILSHQNQGLHPLKIKLKTEVVQIKVPTAGKDPVEVTCRDGTVYRARAVINTMSLGVLKERHATLFSPPLPEQKVKAINDLSIGVVNKIILLFDQIWWNTNVDCFAFIWRSQDLINIAEENKWVTKIFGASLSMANDKSLVFWTSGKEAILVESLPEWVVKSKLMALLRKFMGNHYAILEPVEVVRSRWYSNPYTRGSYSFDNIGTPDYPNARADLSEPIYDEDGNVRLMFAGEATDITHFSTVHGALDSGRREAVRYLRLEYESRDSDDDGDYDSSSGDTEE